MSIIPGTNYVRIRQGLGTIGSVSKTFEADPPTPLEYGELGTANLTNTDPVYYVEHETTLNDITD